MNAQMSEVTPQLQGTFYGIALVFGFGVLTLLFTVCNKLHREVKQNERRLREQFRQRQQVAGWDLWVSMDQKSLLEQRIRNVDRLDLLIRLIGGASILSGIIGFVVLGFKESYGFSAKPGTMAAISLESLPFISVGALIAVMFITYQAFNLDRWFAKTADVALPTNDLNGNGPPAD